MAYRCDALAVFGETAENSKAQSKACDFLVSKQRKDGGWAESYLSSQTKAHPHFSQCFTLWKFCAIFPSLRDSREGTGREIHVVELLTTGQAWSFAAAGVLASISCGTDTQLEHVAAAFSLHFTYAYRPFSNDAQPC